MGACSMGILEFKCEYTYIDQRLDFFIKPLENQIVCVLYDFLKRSSGVMFKKNTPYLGTCRSLRSFCFTLYIGERIFPHLIGSTCIGEGRGRLYSLF